MSTYFQLVREDNEINAAVSINNNTTSFTNKKDVEWEIILKQCLETFKRVKQALLSLELVRLNLKLFEQNIEKSDGIFPVLACR